MAQNTCLFGDPRSLISLELEQRDAEAKVTASFIKQILAANSNASIIAASDRHEFYFIESKTDFVSRSGLDDVDNILRTQPTERYKDLFDQNSQALIHVYVSPRIAKQNPQLERVHVNTWESFTARASE